MFAVLHTFRVPYGYTRCVIRVVCRMVDVFDNHDDSEPASKKARVDKRCVDLSLPLTRGMTSPLFEFLECESWKSILKDQFSEMYFHDLTKFLSKQSNVFPAMHQIFNALNLCPFGSIKVVILGQDPYHDEGQAMGLSFSIPADRTKLPSSLLNIFKEVESDVGIVRAGKNGDLTRWAKNGVLLLNSVLTVKPHTPNSHAGKGWERFTDYIVKQINSRLTNVVFLLWGKFAEKKAARVDKSKHCVLKAPHPSGLSASRGFWGCRHFSKANAFLLENGIEPVDWNTQKETDENTLNAHENTYMSENTLHNTCVHTDDVIDRITCEKR